MKFSIDSVILWPRKNGFSHRKVDFTPDKINIITGASRTGKSAIIPIIDYCLGSEKCTIPVDTIRNACSWFGVLFNLGNEHMLLCRREPGNQIATGDMFILRGNKINIPNTISANTNVTEVNNLLNEFFQMSFLEIDPTTKDFSGRPSYRDFMAFIFQPQNIVANADVMFYKTDTMQHRQRLINIFPYALGAVTPKTLAARQELEKLRKLRDRLLRDIQAVKDVSEQWKQEIAGWIAQAKELGLTNASPDPDLPFDQQIHILSLIVQKTEDESKITVDNIKDMSDDLISLRNEESAISSTLFKLQSRHTEMLQLQKSMNQYEASLQIQVQRLEISSWLRSLMDTGGTCPLCNQVHPGIANELDKLCNAISEIEKSSGDMKSVPAAFERELQVVESEMAHYSEKLTAVRARLTSESRRKADGANKKFTLSEISRFLGRLEASLHTYERIGKDSELETRLSDISAKIVELSRTVDESDIKKKQEAAIKYINQKTSEIVQQLDAEHPNDPVEFLIKDLTLKVKSVSGRDDYLWEIGSASNWLAYHVATILAFQQFFQTRGPVSVPNFVIFDQPSQVYFPQLRQETDDQKIKIPDEDKLAVKKIFSAMSKYLQATDHKVQIIVTEHADEDIWGDVPDIHLVERWRGNNTKLIPLEWLQ